MKSGKVWSNTMHPEFAKNALKFFAVNNRWYALHYDEQFKSLIYKATTNMHTNENSYAHQVHSKLMVYIPGLGGADQLSGNVKGLNLGPQNDIFFSYKQKDGNDAIAVNILHELKNYKVDLWLDKFRGQERSEEGMKAGVKACQLFCCALSKNYFKSNNCLIELEAAIANKKRIVFIFNSSVYKSAEAEEFIPAEFKHLYKDKGSLIKMDEDKEYFDTGIKKLLARFKD